MMCPDQITYHSGAALAVAPVPGPAETEPFAPWDSADLVAIASSTPDVMRGAFDAKTANEAVALLHEGPRGPTARSAVAKEISIQRRLARFAQSLLGVELERFAKGRISERRLRTVETVADRAFRRYEASYRLLLDMEARPAPTVKIRADKAAFAIDARVGT